MFERLADAKSRGDVPYLIDAFRDPKARYYAAQCLGDLGAKEAIPPLIRLLHAGERASRSSAADALARMGALEAVPEIISRLEVEEDFAPRSWMISALGRLGDDAALEPLTRLLADPDVRVRLAAARALGMLGNPEAIEPLRYAAKHERWDNRSGYRKAIKAIKAKRAAYP
jgi:HEAT repeat protein